MEDYFLPISIRFEGAWKYKLSFGWDSYCFDCYFEHEYHDGEYIMIPGERFSLEYRDSPAGIYLAKAVRAFVKAKTNPTIIDERLCRAQFLCTPRNHMGERDPHLYEMTFFDTNSLPHCYDFKVEAVGTTQSITSELGTWLIDNAENSLEMSLKTPDNSGLEPTLLAILNLNRAKFHLDRIRSPHQASRKGTET